MARLTTIESGEAGPQGDDSPKRSDPPRVDVDPTTWQDTAHPTQTLKLQRPPVLYSQGAVRPWEEGVVHVSSEAALRGLNVFEGLRGYHQAGGGFGFVHLRRHFDRLCRSARLLYIPVPFSYEEFVRACTELTEALRKPGNDLYVRATLLVTEGHYGQGTVADLVLTGYQQEQAPPAPISVGVSTWLRAGDVTLPARIKTGANYLVARLSRIEGRGRGHADMILLNNVGRVAESTGACVVIARDGRVLTPPTWEGALESITVDAVAGICESQGVAFERRPIERTELTIADEISLVGTLTEIVPVSTLEETALGEQTVLSAVYDCYRAAVRGERPHPAVTVDLI
jgi:branched-chain amino acid aminotransferase